MQFVALAALAACVGGGSGEPLQAVATGCAAATGCTASTCLRVSEMWSGQFANVTVNGCSDADVDAGTEGANSKFILMAARADNVAHFVVAVEAIGDASRAMVRLGLLMAGHAVAVGASHPVTPGRIELSLDLESELPAGAKVLGPLDFVVLTGVDRNGDATLELDEEVVRSRWMFRVIPEWYYRVSLADLVADDGLLKVLKQPLAADFLKTFLTGEAPASFPSGGSTLLQSPERQWETIRATFGTSDPTRFEPTTELHVYSHKVGIDYNRSNSGLVGRYFFDSNSAVAQRVIGSTLMRKKVIERLLPQVGPHRPFARLRTAESFFDDGLDLFFSFGTAYVDATLFANVDCINGLATLSNVKLSGYMWDLYDFNYFGGELVAEAVKELASVQAGFGTFSSGKSGQIFEIMIILDTPLPEYNGPTGRACSTLAPPPCPTLGGEYSVFTTYSWVCHGSLLASSYSGTRTRKESVVEGQRCLPALGPPIKRNGFIDDNSIFYVRSVIPEEVFIPDAIETALELEGEGTIFANGLQVVFKEHGLVYGEINGVPGRCSTQATSVWTR